MCQKLIAEIEEAQTRLRRAFEQQTVDSKTSCPIGGSPDAPPHSGLCCQCSQPDDKVSHSVSRDELAKAVAVNLQQKLDEVANLGTNETATQPLHDEKGQMFGVLICVAADGSEVVLKAFSGSFDGTAIKEVNGWCPPIEADRATVQNLAEEVWRQKRLRDQAADELEVVHAQKRLWEADQAEFAEAASAREAELTRIGRLQLTAAEWEGLGLTVPEETPKRGSAAYNLVAERMYNPRNAAHKARQQARVAAWDDLVRMEQENYQVLQDRIPYEDALAAQRDYLANTRTITNYRNETRSIMESCCPPSEEIVNNGQMGACAAPKLLAEARRRGLIPVSMAEFWYGKEADSKEHKEFYKSCQYCRSILGFALCGLSEAQQQLNEQLGKKKTELGAT